MGSPQFDAFLAQALRDPKVRRAYYWAMLRTLPYALHARARRRLSGRR